MRCKAGMLGANLTRLWDISTAVFRQSVDVTSLSSDCSGLYFKPDGTSFYLCGLSLNRVGQYDLTTPWDIGTASLAATLDVSGEMSGLGAFGGPWSVFISPSGTQLFVAGDSDPSLAGRSGVIAEYALSVPWSIASAALAQTVSVGQGLPYVWFSSTGSKMFVTSPGQFTTVFEYALSTAWDVSTLSLTRSTAMSGASNYSFTMSHDGRFLYANNFQHEMAIPFDISSTSVVSQGSLPSLIGAFVSDNGSRFWAVDYSADTVSEYTLG